MSRLTGDQDSSLPGPSASTSQEGLESCPRSASSRTLRVTLLSSEWRSTKGGFSTINRELAIQLAKHPNVEVSMYLPQCSEEDKRAAARHKVRLIEAEETPGYDPVDWLATIPKDHVVDCVIGHGVHLGRQVPHIKRVHGNCKWVQLVHTDPEELGMFKSYANAISNGEKKHQAEVKLCKLADQVVAVGSKLAEAFAAYLCSSGKDQDVFNLTPSIFTEFMDVTQAAEERKTFRVLVFGRGDSEDFWLKGYDIAAKAIAELKDMPQAYKLVFVGAPVGEEEKVKELLLKEGIECSQLIVRHFDESREHLAELFCEVDLVIMPSRTEGFGLAAVEALSAGLPVLVSGNSGFGEALQKVPHGSNNVVTSEDPKKWAEAIKKVCNRDRGLRLEEATDLRVKYEQKYSWQGQCDTLIERMLNMTQGATSSQEDVKERHMAIHASEEGPSHLMGLQAGLSKAQASSSIDDSSPKKPEMLTGDSEGWDIATLVKLLKTLYRRRSQLRPLIADSTIQLELEKVYTRLKIISRPKADDPSSGKEVNVYDVFGEYEKGEDVMALAEGSPGIGKTTLCLKLAYDWAVESATTTIASSKFELVLLLKCRDIDGDIMEAISEQLLLKDINEEKRKAVLDFIKDIHNQERILIILDGLDELPQKSKRDIDQLLDRRILPFCHVFATCLQERGIEMRKKFDILLEIKGFTESDACEYIRKHFKQFGPDLSSKGEKLIEEIKENTFLHALRNNPLNLLLLCVIYEDYEGKLPSSCTELYQVIVQCLLRRYCAKHDMNAPDQDKDLEKQFEKDILALGELAWKCVQQDRHSFCEDELKEMEKRNENLVARRLGLLYKEESLKRLKPQLEYYFLHKTFQEYLAACYIAHKLRRKKFNVFEDLTFDDLVEGYPQVFLFVSGLLGEEASLLFEQIDSSDKQVSGQVKRVLSPSETPAPKQCKILTIGQKGLSKAQASESAKRPSSSIDDPSPKKPKMLTGDSEGATPAENTESSTSTGRNILTCTVTKAGVVASNDGVELFCPPGAVDNPVSVKLTLDDQSKYYGLITRKDLENDIMFATPVFRFQPNSHAFKEPVTLTTKINLTKCRCNNIVILHGTEAEDGSITWEDITHNSTLTMLDGTTAELKIKMEHFSLLMNLWNLALICVRELVSRLNLMAFSYKMSVFLNEDSPFSISDELALLLVSKDVYYEQVYQESETSALAQLRRQGFKELHLQSMEEQEEKRIYNSETLHISVCVGEDYKLRHSEEGNASYTVHSHIWWKIGEVIKFKLERTKDVRVLCGTISVQGEYGHASKRYFCERDLCGFVRGLLGVKAAPFNLVPVARMLKTPDVLINEILKSWKDEDKQLEKILKHWSKEKADMAKELAAIRKDLEGLRQACRLTERGQMHVRHLRELASKISGLHSSNVDFIKYFSCCIQNVCKAILRDCCIELQDSAEGVEAAASTADHVRYLQNYRSIPSDIAGKYQMVCSPSAESPLNTFLLIVPNLIQNIKEIFFVRGISEVQNGLKGLPKEACEQFASTVVSAESNKSIRLLACEVCSILEMLCLKNCGRQSTSEIETWGRNLAILSMLNFLKAYFQDCPQHIRLHKRLQLFSGRLREIMSDEILVASDFFLLDSSNVTLSLIQFAKFNPSKLVRFELTYSSNSPASCLSEDVKYDSCHDTFSQQFHVKMESEDELHLHALACVNLDGRICKKGAFESVITLKPSGEDAFDRLMIRFVEVAVIKLKVKDSEDLRVVLCSVQEDTLSELLLVFKEELTEELVDLRRSAVSKCHLKMRTVDARTGMDLSLRLVYKWGSESVALDSKHFETLANSSAGGAYMPEMQIVGLKDPLTSEDAPLSLASPAGNLALSSFDQLQKHGQIRCDKFEYHVHQTVNNMTGHNCVAGNEATLNEVIPSLRALQVPLSEEGRSHSLGLQADSSDKQVSGQVKRLLSPSETPAPKQCKMLTIGRKDSKEVSLDAVDWLSRKIGKWEPLARALGFEPAEVYGIKKDNPGDNAEQAQSMLIQWKQSKGQGATLEVLCKALRNQNVKRTDLAQTMQQGAFK